MAASLLKTLLATALLGTALGSPAADKVSCKQPIEFKTDGSSEFDFSSDSSAKTVLRNVSISQCDVSISADRAEATNIDSKDGRWVFLGNVRVIAEQRGTMTSDRADVELRDNRISKATIRGNPAHFEQKQTADNAQTARGRAGEIVYNVQAGTVRFTNDAWLNYGEREVKAELCLYNIRQQNVHCEKVRGTILPAERPHPSPPPPSGGGETTQ